MVRYNKRIVVKRRGLRRASIRPKLRHKVENLQSELAAYVIHSMLYYDDIDIYGVKSLAHAMEIKLVVVASPSLGRFMTQKAYPVP